MLGWLLFVFSTLNISYHCLLYSTVSTEMSISNISLFSNFFSLPIYFQDFHSVLVFSSFIIMCRSNVCECVCIDTALNLSSFLNLCITSLINFRKLLSHYIFKYCFFSTLSLFTQKTWTACMLTHLTVSHVSYTIYSIISLCCRLSIYLWTSISISFVGLLLLSIFLIISHILLSLLLIFRKSQSTSSLSLFSLHGSFRSRSFFSLSPVIICLSHSWDPKLALELSSPCNFKFYKYL